DITERKKAELALLKANASLEQRVIDRTFDLRTANVELQKAARMKDEFLASMSHELRTPLTGILGLSEAMQMAAYGDLSEKQLKALKNIEASGRHLLSLINDILDLSKIEAGMFEMQFSSSSLDSICQSSLQMVKGLAAQKHQNISLSIDPTGIIFRTDPRRLKQMLVNLLGNAIKFTPDGGNLGIEARGLEQSRLLSITVWDTGIGIREEDLPRLFKSFVQLDSSLSRQYAGTGLGLSLVKRLAELQGGSISVTSTVNAGSRFTIQLPWVEEEPLPVMFNRRVSDVMQHTVSIDPGPEAGEQISTLLKLIGVKNRSILADMNAVDLAAQIFPDLLILRMKSNNSSDIELFNQLKMDVRTQSLPILVITSPEFKEQALGLGAAGVLLESYTQLDLFNELQRIALFIQQPGKTVKSLPGQAQELAKKARLVMMADDNPLIVELVSDFLSSQNFQVSAFLSGAELLAAIEENQPALVLMDIQMPGMNGLAVIRAIRDNRSLEIAHTPIIALTALAMQGDRERCLEAGANEYMTKPLHLQELLQNILALRENHSNRVDHL
ncbi:MAG: response regulator, partial [Chloroflexota bacterium]